jgi:hypothetical protein
MAGDLVRIKFVKDIRSCYGSLTYRKDSQWLLDPVTAQALVIASVAVKVTGKAPLAGR